MSHEHLFYEKEIIRDNEQDKIDRILSKYRTEQPTEELRDKIWDDLMAAQLNGELSIPVTVTLKQDPEGKFPDYVEVALDTRV